MRYVIRKNACNQSTVISLTVIVHNPELFTLRKQTDHTNEPGS
jgi:hypothetical protein